MDGSLMREIQDFFLFFLFFLFVLGLPFDGEYGVSPPFSPFFFLYIYIYILIFRRCCCGLLQIVIHSVVILGKSNCDYYEGGGGRL